MTIAQIAAIIGLLLAFGADPKVVSDVQNTLQATAKVEVMNTLSTPVDSKKFYTMTPEQQCRHFTSPGGFQNCLDRMK